MNIAVIDYGSGNLRSVTKALEHVAGKSSPKIMLVNKAEELREASHIILPGVGAFADCMGGLLALPDMLPALEEEVRRRGKYFLGICVGMQMLFEHGHEHGTHKGLGWLKGEVVKLDMNNNSPLATHHPQLKYPHMGWNELDICKDHPLLSGIKKGDHAYFVHSYHASNMQKNDMLATTQYGQKIVAVVAKGNIMGTQFHPEKSQETGLRLLENFLKL